MITFTVEALPEDIPVRGNAMASGDPMADREVEDAILKRLEAGDVWAWCWIKVTGHDGERSAVRTLGACSYANEAAFRADQYFNDLCEEISAELSR